MYFSYFLVIDANLRRTEKESGVKAETPHKLT